MRLSPRVVAGSLHRIVATAQNGLEVLRFGGLETGEQPSPFQVVRQRPMYRLRRYFADSAPGAAGEHRPAILLVPPMMLDANVYDVAPNSSAVSTLHSAGIDPWVIDFGSPDREAGGLDRTLTDHVLAVSEVVDVIREQTGADVHLGGYSQGGMFCYQAAAYRRARDVASVVTFGSPADFVAGTPLGLPEGLVTKGAEFLADHVFTRIALPGWASRTGFRLLDPVKSARSRMEFIRQLHDREALIGREGQRRFLESEGWVAWSGPAIRELLTQFVVHNRMVAGGFVIDDRMVTLADVTCPILSFVGEIDEIGQPAAVRGIRKAAPEADLYEVVLRAGHFGLVVGSTSTTVTWPTVAGWLHWRDGRGELPELVHLVGEEPEPASAAAVVSGLTGQVAAGVGQLAEVGLGAARGIFARANRAVRTTREIASEAVQALPRLARLGQLQSHTQVSLGLLLAEQARRAPGGECFLFEDRVHTNAAVDTRIDNVVRGLIHLGVRQGSQVGVLMETRPSALVAIAALSRLGAVAVLLPPSADLAAATRLADVAEVIADPQNLDSAVATGARVYVLGGGGAARDLGPGVLDMERIDPASVTLPGWYRPNPGIARDLAFVLFSRIGGQTVAKEITNHRWALSAFGTASAAALTSSDTVYCITPLHHPSGLLTSVGGAIAGGSRIALAKGFDPDRFIEEVRRYGVTVVSYTWTLLREIVALPGPAGRVPIRLFLGSGMPPGLWRRVTERFAPATVLEFYAATEGDAVLANLTGAKPGSKGRPLPGSAQVRLAAYDPAARRFVEDEAGFALPCPPGEVGLLLANPRIGLDAVARPLRGVFASGDTWIATDDLFRRDAEGDYWLVDNVHTIMATARGPVFTQPICDALAELDEVDLAVAYPVAAGATSVVVAAVTAWQGAAVTAEAVTAALSALPAQARPDLVHVVAEIPVTTWFRPTSAVLREAGLPDVGERVWVHDEAEGGYRPLTAADRERLAG